LLLSDAACTALQPAIAALDSSVPVYVCAGTHFAALTGFNIHRGCLALAERPADASLDDVLRDARLVVVLEDVANADNVGGVFRNAAAFGADAVLLSPSSCDPLYRKALRTSMAATLRVPFARIDPEGGLDALRARGFSIVALTPRSPSEPLDEFAAGRQFDRIALVVGAEGSGLTAAVESAADRRVRIPIAPGVDSLNLAVATGIALARLTRHA
jgi:tRNA G18 (ribose-2'-O)-methylase SpoU